MMNLIWGDDRLGASEKPPLTLMGFQAAMKKRFLLRIQISRHAASLWQRGLDADERTFFGNENIKIGTVTKTTAVMDFKIF
jgi:hypothetical protein